MEGRQCIFGLYYPFISGTKKSAKLWQSMHDSIIETQEYREHEKALVEHADAIFKICNDFSRKTNGVNARKFQIIIDRRKDVPNE